MYQESQSQSAASEEVSDISMQSNRNVFQFEQYNVTLRSDFPGGNLAQANINSQGSEYIIQIMGNPDIETDQYPKYWLHFSLQILSVERKLKFILKKAYALAKFLRDRRYKPYMTYRKEDNDWMILSDLAFCTSSFKYGIEMEAAFTVNQGVKGIEKMGRYEFAINFPYNSNNLKQFFQTIQQKTPYNTFLHCKSMAMSNQNEDIMVLALTHRDNTTQENGCAIIKKQVPCIVITGRVHPSEVQASYFIEELVHWLLQKDNISAEIMLQNFAFWIFPMMNPDGVQKGFYRLDTNRRNLNRFYGNANQQTPSIKCIQNLVNELKGRIVMYFDIHGHSSPKRSFMFGNYSNQFLHSVQNRTFCRLLQKKFNDFSFQDSDFSKKNSEVKERYDEFSKMGSGRAYVGNIFSGSREAVFHSYTLEISPYLQKKTLRSLTVRSVAAFRSHMRAFAEAVCCSILETVGFCSVLKWENVKNVRKISMREVTSKYENEKISLVEKIPLFEKVLQGKKGKDITSEAMEEYIQRWLPKMRMKQLVKNTKKFKSVYKTFAIFSFYPEWNYSLFFESGNNSKRSDTQLPLNRSESILEDAINEREHFTQTKRYSILKEDKIKKPGKYQKEKKQSANHWKYPNIVRQQNESRILAIVPISETKMVNPGKTVSINHSALNINMNNVANIKVHAQASNTPLNINTNNNNSPIPIRRMALEKKKNEVWKTQQNQPKQKNFMKKMAEYIKHEDKNIKHRQKIRESSYESRNDQCSESELRKMNKIRSLANKYFNPSMKNFSKDHESRERMISFVVSYENQLKKSPPRGSKLTTLPATNIFLHHKSKPGSYSHHSNKNIADILVRYEQTSKDIQTAYLDEIMVANSHKKCLPSISEKTSK